MTRALILGDPKTEWSWKNDLAPAARLLGWDVVEFDSWRTVTTQEIVSKAYLTECDLFLWPRFGVNVVGDVAEMYHQLKRYDITSVAIHQDLYWDRADRPEFWCDPWWRADYVFTADGSDRRWEDVGINHWWSPPALPERFWKLGTYREDYAHDIVFVGSCQGVHHGRAELLAAVEKRYGKRFVRYGVSKNGPVWGDDLADLYRSAKVVLGDSVDVRYTWSDRIPNTLGRGGILVHPFQYGLFSQHEDNILYYKRGDLKYLYGMLDGALNLKDSERESMRLKAYRHIGEHHLWQHRLENILDIVALTATR